jgi:parallel beta-helix repeat protein
MNSATTPVKIIGADSNIIIKSVIITPGHKTDYLISVVNREDTLNNQYTPDNILIDNCRLTNILHNEAQCIQLTRSNTPSVYSKNITISGCQLSASRKGIYLQYSGGVNIYNNIFNISQPGDLILSYAIHGNSINKASDTINIAANIFNTLSSSHISAGSYGLTAVHCGSKGVYNIFNNMFCGFNAKFSGAGNVMVAIRCLSTSVTANIYYNTILMDSLGVSHPGEMLYTGLYLTSGICNLYNNIFISKESVNKSYCIYKGTSGTLNSNYNNLFHISASGFAGFWKDTSLSSFEDWKSYSSKDQNSISKLINFENSHNLHLDTAFYNDHTLIGTPVTFIKEDFDGDIRNENYPYIGCDEAAGHPLPVEMSGFYGSVKNCFVELSWNTATEINTLKFILYRKKVSASDKTSAWINIGEVPAYGDSFSPKTYSFRDKVSISGLYSYRLSSVDVDGTTRICGEIKLFIETPGSFALLQNYPNPFNGFTKIEFRIPITARCSLELYGLLGNKIKNLFNEVKEAGTHSYTAELDGIASGVYFYRLTAGKYSSVKKLLILK